MNDMIVMILLVAGYIVIQRWILPYFGVDTWMSSKGSCSVEQDKTENSEQPVINIKKIDTDDFDS